MRRICECDRKRLFDALLGDVSMFPPGDLARQVLEEAAARDLQAIEPIIEEILCGTRNVRQEKAQHAGPEASRTGDAPR